MAAPVIDAKIQELIPPLSAAELTALDASIRGPEGCRDPLVVWRGENILLDGHHRLAICNQHGISYKTQEIALADRTAAELWVLRNQLARRNLTPYQKAEIALEIEKREKPAAEARMKATLRRGEKKPAVPTLAQRRTRDKAAAAVGISHGTLDKARLIHEKADKKTKDRLRKGETTINKEHGRIARKEKQKKQAAKAKGDKRIGTANLILGDMRKRGDEVADESVALVFTDPPYEEKALPLWSDLGAFAARVLAPNGLLIAYTGALYLPEVIRRLQDQLDYWWVGSIQLPGTHSRIHARHLSQGSKPLLFFVRDAKTFKPRAWIEDTYVSEAREKKHHPWQQSVGCARHFIEKLTTAKDLVVDPFLGGGTTGVAALELGRDFTGIEIDKASFTEAEERMAACATKSKS